MSPFSEEVLIAELLQRIPELERCAFQRLSKIVMLKGNSSRFEHLEDPNSIIIELRDFCIL